MQPTEETPTKETTTKKPPRNRPFWEIAQDAEGWHWCLWSGNGRQIARSAVPYESKKHVLQAVKLIAPNVNDARLVVKGSEE